MPIRSSCMSLHKGTITLINGIRSALQQQNIVLSDALIVDAINERSQHKVAEQIIAIAAELLEKQLTFSDANVVAILDHFANADGFKDLLMR